MVSSKIAVRCKTFHAARKVYVLECEITSTIESLKAQLVQADTDKELANCKQVRLIYPIVSFTIDPRVGQDPRAARLFHA